MKYASALRVYKARAFAEWLTMRGSSPAVIYHEGNLAQDRRQYLLLTRPGGSTIYSTDEDIAELDKIARLAQQAQADGKVTLAQQRLGPEKFRYIAFKPTRRR